MTLPTIDGLTPAQQTRLDGELAARGLTTYKAQQANIGGVVAALHAVFNIDATVVLAAYHDAEQVKPVQAETWTTAIQPFKRGSKRGKLSQLPDPLDNEGEV